MTDDFGTEGYRQCPNCGTDLHPFRGQIIRKGPSPYPTQTAERNAEDVRACPNPDCEATPGDYRAPLTALANQLVGRWFDG